MGAPQSKIISKVLEMMEILYNRGQYLGSGIDSKDF